VNTLGEDLKSMLSGLIQKENARSLIFDCPVDSDHAEKFYIDKHKGDVICFACARKWDLDEGVALLLNVTREEVAARLYGENTAEYVDALTLEFREDDREVTDSDFAAAPVALKEIRFDPMFVSVSQSDRGMAYMDKRGVTDPRKWERFGVMYHPAMDGVVFPVRKDGMLVGWQCRLIEPKGNLRMVSSEGLPKAQILFNLDNTNGFNNIVLTEGPFDCVKADQTEIGFAAVASFGKGISEAQIEMLLNSQAENIYLGLDRDAVREVEMLSAKMCSKKNVFRVLPPDHRKDLGECTDAEVQAALMSAERCYREKTARLELYVK
jgi:hypothetical protein